MSEHGPTPRRVLVWRHGRTEWNVEHRFQGQPDPPLDEVGAPQAGGVGPTAGRVLAERDHLLRPRPGRQTARPLAELVGLRCSLDPRLREHSLGSMGGADPRRGGPPPPGAVRALAGRPRRASARRRDRAEPGERSLAALAGAEGEHGRAGHPRATAMALTGRLLGLPVTGWRAVGPLGNGRWSEFTADEHGWRLRAHNLGPLALRSPGCPLRTDRSPRSRCPVPRPIPRPSTPSRRADREPR